MPEPFATAACEWCGRAVKRNSEGRWYAVKGEERGYDPLTCEASDDCRHEPDQPATAVLRDWPCTNADHFGLCSDRHVHADHVAASSAGPCGADHCEVCGALDWRLERVSGREPYLWCGRCGEPEGTANARSHETRGPVPACYQHAGPGPCCV